MHSDGRSRFVAGLAIPLAILAAVAGLIILVALLLLYNTHAGALALAAVAASGVLLSISLLASKDRLDPGRRFVAIGAGVLPLLLGGAISLGLIGGIDEADLNVNVEPLLVIPEDAPLIAAEDSSDFCLPDEAGGCEPVDLWEVVPSAEVETVAFVFDNIEVGVAHNVVITELEGSVDDPEQGAEILASDLITGPAVDYYADEQLTWDDLPEQWYFFCAVHPNMNGVGQLAAE